jgi:hypothetical protein
MMKCDELIMIIKNLVWENVFAVVGLLIKKVL